MFSSELAWQVRVPIPCGNCGKEEFEVVAKFVHLSARPCSACGALLDLDTPEWSAFRQTLRAFLVGKKAPLAPVKQPTPPVQATEAAQYCQSFEPLTKKSRKAATRLD